MTKQAILLDGLMSLIDYATDQELFVASSILIDALARLSPTLNVRSPAAGSKVVLFARSAVRPAQ